MPRTRESDHTGKRPPAILSLKRPPPDLQHVPRHQAGSRVVREPRDPCHPRIIPRRSPRSRTSLRSQGLSAPQPHAGPGGRVLGTPSARACMRCTWRAGCVIFPLAQIHFVSGERFSHAHPAGVDGARPRTSWALRGSSRTSTLLQQDQRIPLVENRIEPPASMPGQIKRQNSCTDRP